MMRRTLGLLVTLALGLLWAPLTAEAPSAKPVPTLGVLMPWAPPSEPDWKQHSAFLQELRDRGWREGENLTIEYRWASGRQPYQGADLAAELVRLHVHVIVAQGLSLIRAVQQATSTIPIVMISGDDPVEEGFIASLARPGGNITGVDYSFVPEFSGKLLELLKEAVPTVTRIAVLVYPVVPTTGQMLEHVEVAARALGVQRQVLAVYHPREFEGAFDAAIRERAGALLVLPSLLFAINERQLIALVAKHQLPAIFGQPSFVRAGGLMTYGPTGPSPFRRAAYYVDRILKGAKPADLPVEQPMKFELVINLKTAQALGLTIPPTLLFQADEIIR